MLNMVLCKVNGGF